MQNRIIDWEKIGVYIAVMIGFVMAVSYIGDIRERVAKLEVKVEKLEERK